MDIINKIAVLISWPREIDMLSIFVNDLNIVIIVDDLNYTEKERAGNSQNIIYQLEKKGLSYVLLSNVLGYSKYRILISTAQSYNEVTTLVSYFKYFYAQSIGRTIDLIRLSKLFKLLFLRPLNGGGSSAKKYELIQIERLIGEKIVKFPKGLDVSMSIYPNERWRGVFDIYLCHSNLDYNLIKSKFQGSVCKKIGYPRYDDKTSFEECLKILCNEFNEIDKSKPIIFWVPAYMKYKSESIANIRLWLPIVRTLTSNYNIIIRPHPKTLKVSPEILLLLKDTGLIIDKQFDRKLSELYIASKLVIADYGGSVLDSVYMRKKCILLNLPKHYKYSKWRKTGKYIDREVRKDLQSFEHNRDTDLLESVIKKCSSNDEKNRRRLKDKYFGIDTDFTQIEEFKSELENEIAQY